MTDFRKKIIGSARKKIIFTIHALDEMNNEENIVTVEDVRNTVFNGEIIEDYPEDRGA